MMENTSENMIEMEKAEYRIERLENMIEMWGRILKKPTMNNSMARLESMLGEEI